MTQLLYENLEFRLQTNGDCSAFCIICPPDGDILLKDLIPKLSKWKFVINDDHRGNFICFRAVREENQK